MSPVLHEISLHDPEKWIEHMNDFRERFRGWGNSDASLDKYLTELKLR